MHHRRWERHGDPDACLHGGDDIGYSGAHTRVVKARGPASTHSCAHCGITAYEWAYDHADPNERRVEWYGKWMSISLTPDHYIPLCRSCHRRFDRPDIGDEPTPGKKGGMRP
jgi:NAD-dependent SIR2 family protein deacetylase